MRHDRARTGYRATCAQLVRHEVLGLAGEVDGERAYALASSRSDRPVRQRGHRRGVQPAGEQAAQRHVGDELPPDDVFQQLADRPDRPRQVVVMRMRG